VKYESHKFDLQFAPLRVLNFMDAGGWVTLRGRAAKICRNSVGLINFAGCIISGPFGLVAVSSWCGYLLVFLIWDGEGESGEAASGTRPNAKVKSQTFL
jgi:hypothetical protein